MNDISVLNIIIRFKLNILRLSPVSNFLKQFNFPNVMLAKLILQHELSKSSLVAKTRYKLCDIMLCNMRRDVDD